MHPQSRHAVVPRPRRRPRRAPAPPALRPGVLLLAGLAAACGGGSGGSAVTPPGEAPETRTPPAAVERLLEASHIGSVVDQRARAFSRQVAVLAEDLTYEELERLVPAVQAGFAAELLRRDVAAFIEEEAAPGQIDEVLAWMEGGASAEARRIVDGYEPPLSVQDWLGERTDAPPTPERIRMVARWTRARGTGDFFVLLEQALSEAGHAVWGTFRPGAPAFRPMGDDALMGHLERSFNAAVVTTLHESETVPDDVVRRSIEEFESPSGEWYVRTYQLAVAEAMRAAGLRVVEALGG